MKISSTLLFSLASVIFLNLKICDCKLSERTASAIANIISGVNKFDENFLLFLDEDEMLKDLDMYKVNVELKPIRDYIMKIFKYISNDDQLEPFIHFEEKMIEIDDSYGKMMSMYLQCDETAISHDEMILRSYNALETGTVQSQLKPIRRVLNLFYANRDIFFQKFNESTHAYLTTCSKKINQQSVQSAFHNLLTLIVAAKIKIFSTLNIARDYLNYYKRVEYESTQLKHRHRVNYLNNEQGKVIDVFKGVMQSASANVWRCEPDTYKEDSTHMELKRVFQAKLRSIGDINVDNSGKKSDDCGPRDPMGNYKTREPQLCPEDRKCGGSFVMCDLFFPINLYKSVQICFSEKGSSRTYDYVEQVKHPMTIFGKKDQRPFGFRNYDCKTPMVEIKRYPERHELYYCICDDDLDFDKTGIRSERKFYTGAVMADTSENFVVTGARFRKNEKLGVVYIQIQQGKLLPGGNIDNTTLEWKEISEEDLKNPAFHYNLHWEPNNEGRDIELHDVNLPNKNVLVGIKFNSHHRLRLEALSQPLVVTSESMRLDNDKIVSSVGNFSNDRFETKGIKLPDYSLAYNVVVLDKHLSFAVSDFETDFGQTTVPFIDTQDVTTSQPSPMSGVGLYYRKNEDDDYTGFLGLKLKTYSFSQFLSNAN